jgi:methionine salvage enolase-phosphatase E1
MVRNIFKEINCKESMYSMVKNKLQNFSLTQFEKYLQNDTCETEVNVNVSVKNGWKNSKKKKKKTPRFPVT